MKKIILASQSKTRKLLFDSLGIPFTALPANIDEKSIRDTNLTVRAQKIASAKAHKILLAHPQDIVIACDTFSECEGKVLEKPQSKQDAIEMLMYLSQKSATNYTAFCYIDPENDIRFEVTTQTHYVFRELYVQEVQEYVKLFEVEEWAASIALSHPYIISFIKEIHGSFSGFAYGLPTEYLIPLLKDSGFEPHPQK